MRSRQMTYPGPPSCEKVEGSNHNWEEIGEGWDYEAAPQ